MNRKVFEKCLGRQGVLGLPARCLGRVGIICKVSGVYEEGDHYMEGLKIESCPDWLSLQSVSVQVVN